jgi:hypothetical protein
MSSAVRIIFSAQILHLAPWQVASDTDQWVDSHLPNCMRSAPSTARVCEADARLDGRAPLPALRFHRIETAMACGTNSFFSSLA